MAERIMRFQYLFVIVSFLILSLSFSFADNDGSSYSSSENLTEYQKSLNCIERSWQIHEELYLNNFSVRRINDTIRESEDLLNVQYALEEKGRPADYSSVLTLCDEIRSIRDTAFRLRDEIKVLDEFYNESSEGIDTTNIDVLMNEIYLEMKNERYELVPNLIEKTYSEIILAQSKLATLNVFYDATTKGLKRFFRERWKELVIVFVVIVSLVIFLKKPVERFILQRRLKNIEIRKSSLKSMISKNQDVYFNKGKISEESFTIKNKKLAELIRDIDRQISLLKEQIYSLENGSKARVNLSKTKAKTKTKSISKKKLKK